MGKLCAGCDNERSTRRPARRLVIFAVLLGLSACSPVETWRDLTGASRNDPDPETTPNTKNLAAGEASDYPNLATVPPPPVRALTSAEREKLTQSLIADRVNARHTDEQLRAGFSPVAAAPPPPRGEPGAQPEQVAAAPPSSLAPVASAPGAAASSASASNGAAGGRSAKLLPSLSAQPALASNAVGIGAAGEKPALPPAAAAPPAAHGSGGKTRAEPGQGLRKQGEPPEPGPMESSLEVPQARATPEPEQIQPAPPSPQLPPTPKVAAAPAPLPGGLAAGGALAPMPLSEAKRSAGYEPPPAPPQLPPAPPTRTAAVGPGKGGVEPPARVGTPVAEIKFGGDSSTLTDKDRRTLETVVPAYRQNPGRVRIVGYAGSAGGAVEQLESYRTALDRAQAVAAALTKAGIPSDKIQVEAAPQGENAGESRAEVLLEH